MKVKKFRFHIIQSGMNGYHFLIYYLVIFLQKLKLEQILIFIIYQEIVKQ